MMMSGVDVDGRRRRRRRCRGGGFGDCIYFGVRLRQW